MVIRNGRIYNDRNIVQGTGGGSNGTSNPMNSRRNAATGAQSRVVTVTFDRCGGTTVDPVAVMRGESVTLPTSRDTSRRGFVLAGWANPSTPTRVSYNPGQSVAVDHDVTFRAVWRRPSNTSATSQRSSNAPRTYAVTLDMGNGRRERVTGLRGDVTLPRSEDLPSPGRVLTGWMCRARSYGPGSTVHLTSDMVFTAVWGVSPRTFRVVFDTRGGSPVSERIVHSGRSMDLPRAVNTRRAGYVLNAWEIEGRHYEPGDSVPIDHDCVANAVWVPAPVRRCRVSFDTRGGGSVNARTVNEGDPVRLPFGIEVRRNGFVLKGWEVNGRVHDPGSTINPVGDCTAVAVWEPVVRTFRVGFDSRGGVPVNPLVVDEGDSVRLPSGDDVRRRGFILRGWTVDGHTRSPGSSFAVDHDCTAFAVWEPVPPRTFHVRFDTNGGSSLQGITVTEGDTFSLPSKTDVRKEGWTLSMWILDGCSYDPGYRLAISHDATAVAMWDPKPLFTVNFDSAGGSVVSPLRVRSDSKITLPSASEVVYGTFELKGWMLGERFLKPGEVLTVTGNIVLRAVWRCVEHTVDFDTCGGSFIPSSKVRSGETFNLPSRVSREGYRLVGWREGSRFLNPGSLVTIRSDTRFTAVWERRVCAGTSVNSHTSDVGPRADSGNTSITFVALALYCVLFAVTMFHTISEVPGLFPLAFCLLMPPIQMYLIVRRVTERDWAVTIPKRGSGMSLHLSLMNTLLTVTGVILLWAWAVHSNGAAVVLPAVLLVYGIMADSILHSYPVGGGRR